MTLLCVLLMISTALPAADTDGLIDPMRPPGRLTAPLAAHKTVEKAPEWRLEAVLNSPERAVAVISGQSLQVGDKLDGYTLVKIEPTQVLLQKQQKKILLHRSGTGLKKALSSQGVTKGSPP